MGKYRKRFNEKARSGMLAKQAKLKRERNKQFFRSEEDPNVPQNDDNENTEYDPNAEVLKPMSDIEKQERKRKLQEQLFLENEKEVKMSKAKKKRLDKYIEHQIKREEKKVLLEKLSKTKVDTAKFAPSKLLGSGKQTRKQEMIEALELERQGRANDRTKDILYEEHDVKDANDLMNNSYSSDVHSESDVDDSFAEDEDKFGGFGPSTSTFIDSRPAKFGGSGTGFGFANLPVIEKLQPKKKYSWRKALEVQNKKKKQEEDADDFASTTDEENSGGSNEENSRDSDERDASESDEISKEETDSEIEVENGEVNGDLEEDVQSEDNDSESDSESGSNSDSSNEDEADDEELEGDEDLPRLLQNKPKHSKVAESFKEWAEEQVKKLEGRNNVPLLPEVSDKVKKEYSKPTIREEDIDHSSDEEGYIPINKDLQRDAFYVNVERTDTVQQLRMQLPVFNEEHRIMEAINHHDCVVICGETGSGKTTQVPQFLYEAGFGNTNSPNKGMIGITQPRRVAAVSMANRLGNELGDHGHRVGYQIRFDSTISNEGKPEGTAVKFMTDGVLLREIMADFLLTKYSVIIVDEAHERNINTDILIGLLSRLLKLRRQYHHKEPAKFAPLKLVIMSATLRVSDFSENTTLFKIPPPIIKVDARQYPVSVHFNKRTPFEYLDEAFNKACKIHRKLPPGGILIFLTSQAEITLTVKRLRSEFPLKKRDIYKDVPEVRLSKDTDAEAEDIDFSVGITEKGVEETQDDYESDSEEEGFDEIREPTQTDNDPLYVLPLYSLLPTSEQMKVFQDPPGGSRVCIVATNVAETSLTIPGIRYVVDCGRAKERKYNEETGVQSFEIDWVSKASADQRAGRAGRTGPGHCYRLFSSAVYEDFFLPFGKPEILRMPVESVVLNMKSMGIDKIVNFPFPTPPDRNALKKAEKLLIILGALDKSNATVTAIGKLMSLFPLSPRFSKILLTSDQAGCLPYIVALVSALSVGDPFLGEHEVHNDDNLNEGVLSKLRKSRAQFLQIDHFSDAIMLLSAVCAMDHVKSEDHQKFFQNNFLRPKVMEEINKLRSQIFYIVKTRTRKDSIAEQAAMPDKLPVPSKAQIAAMKQMIASGFLDQIAIRGDLVDLDIKLTNKMNVINIAYSTVLPSSKYDDKVEPGVYIHPTSVLTSTGKLPAPYLVFHSLTLSQNKVEGKLQKLRMRPLVDISPNQLANVAKSTPLITYSKPLGHPYAPKNISPTKRECYVVPRFGAAMGESGIGWDLPVLKVVQVKKNGSWLIDN